MKKFLFLALIPSIAFAGYDDARFNDEVAEGLDLRIVRETGALPGGRDAPGQLGFEVYRDSTMIDSGAGLLFVPDKDFYVRVGGGVALPALSDKVIEQGWGAHIGFGWNAGSYVRIEADAQYEDYDLFETQSAGATLYFDLARRWVRSGDITVRRTFVPYMGLGVRGGNMDVGGVSDFYAAPNAVLGFNVMFNDTLGLDIAYRFQLQSGAVTQNVSDVIASIRVNF